MGGFIHINRTGWNWHWTPPWASHERLTDCAPDELLLTDCCCCRMRADETVCDIKFWPDNPRHGERWPHVKFLKSLPKWDADREDRHWWMSYYDATVRVQCGPGFGCTVNAKRKRGKEMREYWRYAA